MLLRAAFLVVLTAVYVNASALLEEPPRFDGAGYSVLALSLVSGQGYHALEHPDRPPNTHYPPGYPAALAAVWSLTGPSARAAHLLSFACTVAAVLATWGWFRTLYRFPIPWGLAIVLALNWRWARDGAVIRSEPLYQLLTALALLLATRVMRRGRDAIASSAALGLLLGATILTRHVGIGLAAAVLLALGLAGQRRPAAIAGLVAAATVAPWALWILSARQVSQLDLLSTPGTTLAAQALFYVRRIPDQLTAPLVEVGTVFRPGLGGLMTAWACAATAVVLWGAVRTLRSPRRRLAGLVLAATFPILLAWPFQEAGRFLVPLIPFLLVATVEALGALLARLRVRRPRRLAVTALMLLAFPYSTYSALAHRAAAEARAHAPFDAACAWIAQHGHRPGPVLTRYPGDLFWQTRRPALAPPEPLTSAALRATIRHYGVAYLLVEGKRYAREAADPLRRLAADPALSARLVWSDPAGGSTAVFEVDPDPRPAPPVRLPPTSPLP